MARVDAQEDNINRLNAMWHIAGTIGFQRPHLFLFRRVSHTLAPPDTILPYLGRLVECWHPETLTFHLPLGECTITLQDVAYYFGLRMHDELAGGCLCDFQTWYQHPTLEWVEELLGVSPHHAQQQ
ncbi:uncharacterized protein DS421_15g501660 [Arachis hypogaea]|nr:uncharacterized protein DS421_15g501660 [Arachis hypogaea]